MRSTRLSGSVTGQSADLHLIQLKVSLQGDLDANGFGVITCYCADARVHRAGVHSADATGTTSSHRAMRRLFQV